MKEKEEEASCWGGDEWLLSEPTSLGLDQSIKKAKLQFTQASPYVESVYASLSFVLYAGAQFRWYVFSFVMSHVDHPVPFLSLNQS